MFFLRIAVPDRPGALGAIATAMGTVGADIVAVEVVERRDGLVVDDFMVQLPAETQPDTLVTACSGVPGAQMLWLSFSPEAWDLHADIDLLNDMTANPTTAAAILTKSAPDVFHATWAILVDRENALVLNASELAPDLDAEALTRLGPLTEPGNRELPQDWFPSMTDTLIAVAPLRDNRSIVVGRHGGPDFMTSEVARLRYLAALAD